LKSARAAQQAGTGIARYLPGLPEKASDWRLVTERLKDGERLVSACYFAAVYAPVDAIDAAEQAVRTLYHGQGWRMAAERYGLKVVARSIEDLPDNKTRFLVLRRQDVGPSGQDKSSILVSTRNEPGALFRVLEPFHRHGISLTRIETRPARSGDWSYVFFIDFDGHAEQPIVHQALDDVAQVALEVRILGCYPRSVM